MDITFNDFVTCLFDLSFIYAEWLCILALYRDKVVVGVDLRKWMLSIAWGLWATFVIYKEAHLPIAQLLNVIWLIEISVWLGMALYYKRNVGKE